MYTWLTGAQAVPRQKDESVESFEVGSERNLKTSTIIEKAPRALTPSFDHNLFLPFSYYQPSFERHQLESFFLACHRTLCQGPCVLTYRQNQEPSLAASLPNWSWILTWERETGTSRCLTRAIWFFHFPPPNHPSSSAPCNGGSRDSCWRPYTSGFSWTCRVRMQFSGSLLSFGRRYENVRHFSICRTWIFSLGLDSSKVFFVGVSGWCLSYILIHLNDYLFSKRNLIFLSSISIHITWHHWQKNCK